MRAEVNSPTWSKWRWKWEAWSYVYEEHNTGPTLSPSPSSLPSTRPSVRRLLFLQQTILWSKCHPNGLIKNHHIQFTKIMKYSLNQHSSCINLFWCCGVGDLVNIGLHLLLARKIRRKRCHQKILSMPYNFCAPPKNATTKWPVFKRGNYLVCKITVTEWLCQEDHPALCIVWGNLKCNLIIIIIIIIVMVVFLLILIMADIALVKVILHSGVLVIVGGTQGWSSPVMMMVIMMTGTIWWWSWWWWCPWWWWSWCW